MLRKRIAELAHLPVDRLAIVNDEDAAMWQIMKVTDFYPKSRTCGGVEGLNV